MSPADIIEADRIKDRIRGAKDRDALTSVVNDERAAIEVLEKAPDCAMSRKSLPKSNQLPSEC